jgi:uncharacterized protein YeaO (DUF488 family)
MIFFVPGDVNALMALGPRTTADPEPADESTGTRSLVREITPATPDPAPLATADPEPADESTGTRSLVREITPATPDPPPLSGTPSRRRDLAPDLDDEMLRRCIAGERDAWDQFARRYQHPLFAFVSRELDREHRAVVEEHVQEVMIDAFADFHNFTIGSQNPFNWLPLSGRSARGHSEDIVRYYSQCFTAPLED